MPVLVDFSVKNTFSINETVVLLIETESSLRRTAAGEYAKPAAQKGSASCVQGLAVEVLFFFMLIFFVMISILILCRVERSRDDSEVLLRYTSDKYDGYLMHFD